ncbi:hypothetical protein, partial [Pantoea sp.]|uniref:hypothetical protein n=1 Tax=Pantoea sp. TaxID=69393 RepID=UPI0028AC12B6
PTDYKSVALPTELSRHQVTRILGRADAGCNKKIAKIALSLTICANPRKSIIKCSNFVQWCCFFTRASPQLLPAFSHNGSTILRRVPFHHIILLNGTTLLR